MFEVDFIEEVESFEETLGSIVLECSFNTYGNIGIVSMTLTSLTVWQMSEVLTHSTHLPDDIKVCVGGRDDHVCLFL